MAITATPYGQFIMKMGTGGFNLPADTFKVLLTTSGYVPNIDTHASLTDVTNELADGVGGYTAGGKQLTGQTWTYDAGGDRGVLGANVVTWAGAAFTCRYAVIYKAGADAASSPLVGFIDFGADKTLNTEDFVLSFANGVVRIRVV